MVRLKACEKQLCTMIMEKNAKGDDLKCDVQKTWAKSSLEGGQSKGVSWGFGDARCTANIVLSRNDLVAALTLPKYKVFIPAHQVNCVIERDGEVKPLTIKLAPKLVFKAGKADKVWINVQNIDGPADAKSTIWGAAQLEDSIGIFHAPLIKQINKFMYTQCPKRYGPGAEAQAKTKAAKDKAALAAKGKQKAAAKVATPAAKPADTKAPAATGAPAATQPAPPEPGKATASAP